MSLRQFIASRKILRPVEILTNMATDGWKEVAALLGLEDDVFHNPLHKEIETPVTAVLIGAGHRGTIYADYAKEHPDELQIVAVADNNSERRRRTARKHKIAAEHCYHDWKEVFTKEKLADAVIIATPDQLHSAPCLAALDAGYDVLLEKPIAPTEEECRMILK